MNIWIVNHFALPPDQAGGTRHYSLAQQLVRRGHSVTVLASSINYQTRKTIVSTLPGHVLETVVDGVTFVWIRVPDYLNGSLARLWNMLVFSWRLITNNTIAALRPPDVVIGSSPHLFAAWSALRLARRSKAPFVLEVRDLWPDSLIDLGGMSPMHPLIIVFRRIEKHLYRRADSIVTVLGNASDYLASKGGNPQRISWLPNGISTELADGKVASHGSELPLKVVYAGAHGLANNLDMVVQAATLLHERGLNKRVTFQLIGDGPEKARLQHMVEERGLLNVTFLDPVRKRDIHAVLARADAGLLLLKDSPVFRWGISPNKLFDYFLVELPVLFGVRTPSNPVSEQGAGISFDPTDPQALADACLDLASSSAAQRAAMGRAGRQYVLAHHDFSVLGTQLAETLEQLIAS